MENNNSSKINNDSQNQCKLDYIKNNNLNIYNYSD